MVPVLFYSTLWKSSWRFSFLFLPTNVNIKFYSTFLETHRIIVPSDSLYAFFHLITVDSVLTFCDQAHVKFIRNNEIYDGTGTGCILHCSRESIGMMEIRRGNIRIFGPISFHFIVFAKYARK